MLLSNNKLIAGVVKLLVSEKEKQKGLTFTRPKDNVAYFFYYSKPSYLLLHMFFVFYKLDIIFVDEDFNVLKVLKNVLPFTPLIFPPKGARHFIETKAGLAKEIKVGHKLRIL